MVATSRALVSDATLRTKPQKVCPICGDSGRVFADKVSDRLFNAPGEWRVLECPSVRCRVMWLDPQPEPDEIHKLYFEYFTHSDCKPSANPQRSFWSQLQDLGAAGALGFHWPSCGALPWASLVAKLGSLFGPIREFFGGGMLWVKPQWRGRLLDVGCGGGDLLRRLKTLGWDVQGLEPDSSAAAFEIGAAYEFPVRRGILPQCSIPSDSFDVITLSHVIEHVSDPLDMLRECNRLLRPGGRVVVATPNVESFGRSLFGRDWVHLDPPRHLTLFTAQTLGILLQRAGLQVENIRTSSRSMRFVWSRSQMIRKNKARLRSGTLLQIVGGIMQIVEHYFFHSRGEELIAVATKPKTQVVGQIAI